MDADLVRPITSNTASSATATCAVSDATAGLRVRGGALSVRVNSATAGCAWSVSAASRRRRAVGGAFGTAMYRVPVTKVSSPRAMSDSTAPLGTPAARAISPTVNTSLGEPVDIEVNEPRQKACLVSSVYSAGFHTGEANGVSFRTVELSSVTSGNSRHSYDLIPSANL